MTKPTLSPAAPHREVGGLDLLLQELHDTGASLWSEVQERYPTASAWVDDGYLRRVTGVLGPVVSLGPRGQAAMGVTRVSGYQTSAWGLTVQVALKKAVLLAHRRGYTIVHVTAQHLRLNDPQQRECILIVRVATGSPNATTIAKLVKKHRNTLRRSRGKLIVVVQDKTLYRYQMGRQPLLEVWGLDDQ